MRVALVSDIHSNIEALDAVLRDIASKNVQRVFCLGDVVGYGPNPGEALDAARCFDVVIKGNHDQAVGFKIPKKFKVLAAKAAFWTRKQLKPGVASQVGDRRRWDFLRRNLKKTHALGNILLAHGSPVSNMDYIYDPEDAAEVFEHDLAGVRMCFVGHTHLPGMFLLQRDEIEYVAAEPDKRYRLKAEKAIVNVGSVGQPRDGDPRASWLLLRDDGTFSYRRVPYEAEKTAEKIHAIRRLDPSLGDRLIVGE